MMIECTAAQAREGSMNALKKEFEYYLEHQQELVRKYRGKVIVIVDHNVVGSYDSELEAVTDASKTHKPGTFLVQRCEPGSEAYTHTYHSRIAFV